MWPSLSLYLPSVSCLKSLLNAAGLTNGADSVREVVSQAKYMVLGLGDVYLGAPCAVPVDPRSACPCSPCVAACS